MMSTDEHTPTTRGIADVLADMRDVVKVERPDDAVRVPVSDLAMILSHLAARDAEVAERIAQAIEADRGDAPWAESRHDAGVGHWLDSRDATKAARIAREAGQA
jgi:hypothetical protein